MFDVSLRKGWVDGGGIKTGHRSVRFVCNCLVFHLSCVCLYVNAQFGWFCACLCPIKQCRFHSAFFWKAIVVVPLLQQPDPSFWLKAVRERETEGEAHLQRINVYFPWIKHSCMDQSLSLPPSLLRHGVRHTQQWRSKICSQGVQYRQTVTQSERSKICELWCDSIFEVWEASWASEAKNMSRFISTCFKIH